MSALLRWIAAVLVVAAAVHAGLLFAAPWAIMHLAMDGIAERAGGRNAPVHAPRADHTARGIVMPSPDLLYTACAFDLADGPVRLRAPVPADTYWSVAAYAANSDNFFVLNDGTAQGTVDVTLAAPGADAPAGAIASPTQRGIVLFRTLIADEARLPELAAANAQMTCGR